MQHTMSSRKGDGKPFVAGAAGGSTSKVDKLSHDIADISLDSTSQDGDWEVFTRKSKNKAGGSSAKSWGTQNSSSKAWEHPNVAQKSGMRTNNSRPALGADSRRPAGRGNSRPHLSSVGTENNYFGTQPVIGPPLAHGWNRAVAHPSEDGPEKKETPSDPHSVDDDDDDKVGNDDDSDAVDSDDELLSDEYDSDVSVKSHESCKKSKWFKAFFEKLDKLTLEEISEPARQWHCPACQGGPGAIDWYRGLQPLMTHAKTKGSKRVKLHREFAELLDEELRRRGTSVIPAGESFGKWKGLNENVKDREIVWPPMVIIMNTKLEQDENEKWIGMGNQELLDYFSSYDAVKARHSYGPQGHRGMSVLLFESSAMGYVEAERLHNHFREQGTDREAWDQRRVLFYPGGKRQLYGYLAEKRDLDIFNQHCHGKSNSRLKFDLRSYQEMVVEQIKQMSEDNQQLIWFKDKVAKEKRHSKALEQSLGIMSEKLRKTSEENRIVRQRSKMHHDQNKESMDSLEQFFKDKLNIIHEARDAKEDSFEKIQQEEREKVKSSSTPERRQKSDEIKKFIQFQQKEMDEFVAERENLIKLHEDNKMAMKQRHWEELVGLEKEFDAELDRLMEKYAPHSSEEGNKTDK